MGAGPGADDALAEEGVLEAYYPPDVSGWDDKRWLDTNTTLGRWEGVVIALDGDTADPEADYPAETPSEALKQARDFWGAPTLTTGGVAALNTFAQDAISADADDWQRASRQNALRQLIAGSPDYQTS